MLSQDHDECRYRPPTEQWQRHSSYDAAAEMILTGFRTSGFREVHIVRIKDLKEGYERPGAVSGPQSCAVPRTRNFLLQERLDCLEISCVQACADQPPLRSPARISSHLNFHIDSDGQYSIRLPHSSMAGVISRGLGPLNRVLQSRLPRGRRPSKLGETAKKVAFTCFYGVWFTESPLSHSTSST